MSWLNSLLTLLEDRPKDTWEWDIHIACRKENMNLEINYNEENDLWMCQEYSKHQEGRVRLMEPGLYIEGSRNEFLRMFFSLRRSIEEQLGTINEKKNPQVRKFQKKTEATKGEPEDQTIMLKLQA